jgi:hypothetical protein
MWSLTLTKGARFDGSNKRSGVQGRSNEPGASDRSSDTPCAAGNSG